MNKSKIKLLFVLNCLLAGTLSAKSDILSENIRDYRTTVDAVSYTHLTLPTIYSV